MEHFSNGHKNHPNQHEKSHKLCHEKWRRLMSLREIQSKLRQQHDQNFYEENIRESHIKRNTSVRRKKKRNPEEQDLESHSQPSE